MRPRSSPTCAHIGRGPPSIGWPKRASLRSSRSIAAFAASCPSRFADGAVISCRRATWRELSSFRDDLRRERYTAVLDLQEQVKGALIARLARGVRHGPDRASIREPVATLAHDVHHAIDPNQHLIDRCRQLAAAALGYRADGPPRFGFVAPALGASGVMPDRPYMIFLHATSRADKTWPEANWRALIGAFARAGFAVLLPWGTQRRACAQRAARRRRGGRARSAAPAARRARGTHRARGARRRRRHGSRAPVRGAGHADRVALRRHRRAARGRRARESRRARSRRRRADPVRRRRPRCGRRAVAARADAASNRRRCARSTRFWDISCCRSCRCDCGGGGGANPAIASTSASDSDATTRPIARRAGPFCGCTPSRSARRAQRYRSSTGCAAPIPTRRCS